MRKKIEKIKNLRKKKNFSISVAESCTGGMISSHLTSIDGASQFFDGSIVSYSNDMKEETLGVKKKTLLKFGAVSHQTALEMLRGMKKNCKSKILISVTGVAGPTGGTAKTPVGCVFFGVATKIKSAYKFKTIKKIFKKSTRRMVQIKSTDYVLDLIIKEINSF